MHKYLFVAFTLFTFGNLFAQSIENTWKFSEVKDQNGLSVLDIHPQIDYLKLKDGSFEYHSAPEDSLKASGDYLYQDKLLVLFLNNQGDSIRRFRVEQFTESTLTLSEGNYQYELTAQKTQATPVLAATAGSQIIPN